MDLQDLTSFKSSKFEPERALRTAVGLSVAPLWGAFFVAAGAGAAYWWMTSWTRRQGEASEAAETPKAVGEPLSFAPPAEAEGEEVMAHQPEPQPETPVEDLVTADLAVAPEEVMEHAPVEAAAAAAEAPVDLAPVAEALTIETQSAIKPAMEEAPASLTPKRPTPPKSARSQRKAARTAH